MPYKQSPQLTSASERRHLLLGGVALAGCAGFVNAVLLSFFLAPVSHMSGAVSHLGVAIATRQPQLVGTLSVIAAFFAGSVVSGLLIGRRHGQPGRSYGVALLIEGGVL